MLSIMIPINQQIQGTNNHKRKKNNITRSLCPLTSLQSHGLIVAIAIQSTQIHTDRKKYCWTAIANKPMTIDFSEIFLSKSFHFVQK